MLKDSTVSDNKDVFSSVPYGGGIANTGHMTISGSTISDNECFFAEAGSDASGGGIYNFNTGVMQIQNSTISGNYGEIGGGIFNAGSLAIRNSTIANNITATPGSGGGIVNQGSLILYDTIVTGSKYCPQCGYDDRPPDLNGPFTGSANLIGGNPMLGPLQYNGGRTMTHALLPGSPAIDAGDNTGAPEFDQRGPGFPRIVNGTVDIGAFEVQSAPMPAPPMMPTYGSDLFTLILGTADFDALD